MSLSLPWHLEEEVLLTALPTYLPLPACQAHTRRLAAECRLIYLPTYLPTHLEEYFVGRDACLPACLPTYLPTAYLEEDCVGSDAGSLAEHGLDRGLRVLVVVAG